MPGRRSISVPIQLPYDDRADDVFFTPEGELEDAMKHLEEENCQWAHLADVRPLEAEQFSGEIDPWLIDAELKGFVEKRARWDETFGPVALLFQTTGAWDALEYASFGHYCEERLEMSERAVGQRVAFERNLPDAIPAAGTARKEDHVREGAPHRAA
jgi:hypothetical protein